MEQIISFFTLMFVLFCFFYIKQKAKNYATREDIREITKTMEDIKIPYQVLLENIKALHSMRSVAAEKRLQVAQEAYNLLSKLLFSLHNMDLLGKTVEEYDLWWGKNCLYLEEKSFNAFAKARTSAILHNATVNTIGCSEVEDAKKILKECFNDIQEAGKIIRESVELPPFIDKGTDFTNIKLEELK